MRTDPAEAVHFGNCTEPSSNRSLAYRQCLDAFTCSHKIPKAKFGSVCEGTLCKRYIQVR